MADPSIPEKLVSCGFLIYRGQPIESFLLMEHKKRLDLPKGHVEPGESEMECAYRELEEETGIKSADIEVDPDFRHTSEYEVRYKKYDRQPIPKTTVIFLARLLVPVEIQITEHKGFHWHPWSPPHSIQEMAIDPLLANVESHFAG